MFCVIIDIRMRHWWGFLFWIFLLFSLGLGGCRSTPAADTPTPATEQPVFPADTATPASVESATLTLIPSVTAEPSATPPPVFPEFTLTAPAAPPTVETVTLTPEPSLTSSPVNTDTPVPTDTPLPAPTDTSLPAPTDTPAGDVYPPPVPTATSIYWDYPPPVFTATSIYSGYPEPGASSTPSGAGVTTPAAGTQPVPTATQFIFPSLTPTQRITPTRPAMAGPTATEYIGRPLSTRQPVGSTVTIWHGWTGLQAEALVRIIDSFQAVHPDISFYVTYIPQDELRGRYEAASYYGAGPSLLLAPAAWGPAYVKSGLVTDISVYASQAFLATLNSVAVDTLRSGKALFGLPYAQQGYVLYRNASFLPQSSASFDELVTAAKSVTRGGRVGVYFDREAIVSSASLLGLGGQLMDESGFPVFTSAQGLAWMDLLAAYAEAGLAGLHTNRDLILFEEGKIGYIIEGTWRLNRLVSALGEEKVAIDPWPAFDSGHLSGYVQTDAVFLNTNVQENDRLPALRFMGYLLSSEVQTLLGESGFIPTVLLATPRSLHIQQAMVALQGGTAWPFVDEQILSIYWNALDEAIASVFVRGTSPASAIQSAKNIIIARMNELGSGE